MPLLAAEVRKVVSAVRALPLSAPSARVEDFIATTLGLNLVQQAQYFPSPDPANSLENAVARLTAERDTILRDECVVPEFVVFQDAQKVYHVAGLDSYLAAKPKPPDAKVRARLAHHRVLRSALRRIQKGHNLEALAAAIMKELCSFGEATKGSGDQGIDAIGWKQLLDIDPCFSDGDFAGKKVFPGEKVFLFASSKAATDGGAGAPGLISPAHIRELVGGWVIQRSSVGRWQEVGIRMLSPVQMILVTTYRLSESAKSVCSELGVQIWGIPELIYLICVAAPDTVFDPANNHAFSALAFKAWWKARDTSRLQAS